MRFARAVFGALTLFAMVDAAACRTQVETPLHGTSVREARMQRSIDSFAENGFVEMVPAIVPATTPDARERITIWLRIPQGWYLGARWSERQHRYVLRYPPGTVADRVDLVYEDGAWRIADVRGTTFLARTEEFHVLRPDTDRPAWLSGFAWIRGDDVAQSVVTRRLVDLACREPGTDVAFLQKRNACEQCHVHDKAASRHDRASDDMPIGATDDGGLYEILDVLRDDVEVDDSRGRDVSIDDPHVRFRCPTGTPRLSQDRAGRAQVTCPQRHEVPVAVLDLREALRGGDEHARAVCSSRRYLLEHADDSVRRAFADPFRECGLADSSIATPGGGGSAQPRACVGQ